MFKVYPPVCDFSRVRRFYSAVSSALSSFFSSASGAWATALSPTFRGQEGSWPILVRASDATGEVRESTLTLRSHDGGETWSWED